MTSKRQKLISTALCILSSQSALMLTENSYADAPKKTDQKAKCFGINSCKGQNGCAVLKDQIEKVQLTSKDKFSKAAQHECAGLGDCAAKGGHLGWIALANTEECLDKGGFVFEKNEKKELVIRQKDGVK